MLKVPQKLQLLHALENNGFGSRYRNLVSVAHYLLDLFVRLGSLNLRIEIKPIEFKHQSYFVAGLVFDFASPPTNSNNTKAVYNNAKEFMKSSATIQAQYKY